MKKIVLTLCLLVAALAAQAQFERGKWIVNPSLTGLSLSHNTETDRTTFGLQGEVGSFMIDNLALMVGAGAEWNYSGTNADVYQMGVGVRYYLNNGIYVGVKVNMDHLKMKGYDESQVGFGAQLGYAFFLNRTVTIEPAAYWNINEDRSHFGLKVGFGFYF